LEVLCGEVAESITTTSNNLGAPSDTLCLALTCFGRCSAQLSPYDADFAHLVGLACLWLSTKFDFMYATTAGQLLESQARSFTTAELVLMEQVVFRHLGYRVDILTSTDTESG
jgi:hypothetical protein